MFKISFSEVRDESLSNVSSQMEFREQKLKDPMMRLKSNWRQKNGHDTRRYSFQIVSFECGDQSPGASKSTWKKILFNGRTKDRKWRSSGEIHKMKPSWYLIT